MEQDSETNIAVSIFGVIHSDSNMFLLYSVSLILYEFIVQYQYVSCVPMLKRFFKVEVLTLVGSKTFYL